VGADVGIHLTHLVQDDDLRARILYAPHNLGNQDALGEQVLKFSRLPEMVDHEIVQGEGRHGNPLQLKPLDEGLDLFMDEGLVLDVVGVDEVGDFLSQPFHGKELGAGDDPEKGFEGLLAIRHRLLLFF